MAGLSSLAIGGPRLAYAEASGKNVTAVLPSDPPGLVLAFPQDGAAQTIGTKIYEGLLEYSTDLQPQPSLARGWSVSPDGLTYSFMLQPAVTWSDGKEFSSADVVFSLQTMLPVTSAGARQVLDQIESINAPDAATVVVRLKRPVPYFLMQFPALYMPMMPRHIYEGTDFAKNPANANPIGTGPFKLAEWHRGSFVRLVRHQNYWNKSRPRVDSLTFRIIPDASSRAIALDVGDADIATDIDLNAVDVSRFRSNPEFKVTPLGWEYFSPMRMLEMNWRKPLLADVRFRRALYYAVDRKFMLDRIFLGVGRPATGPVNSKIPYYSTDVPTYGYDPNKARAILDEMGFRVDSAGSRRDAGGNAVKIPLLVLPGDERWARVAEYLREAWKAIGLEVELQTTDPVGWANRIRNWDYDIAITALAQNADPGIGLRRYFDSSSIRKGVMFTNTSGYSNADVDRWFAEADVEMDHAKRAELYARIQRKLAEDVAMLWLIEIERLTIYRKNLNDLITTAFGPRGPWNQLAVK